MLFTTVAKKIKKAFDIIMLGATILKSYILGIFKQGIHKAESNIQLCLTLPRRKIASLDWDSKQAIRGK